MTYWDTLWSVLGVIFSVFVFAAYLIVVFMIVNDLFRDHKLAGWAKGIWIIALIFVPFLTALVYFIARGRDMSERQYAFAQEGRAATDEYVRQAARPSSPAQEIEHARSLFDGGTITADEYDHLKTRALGRPGPS